MIAYLKGQLTEKQPTRIVVEAGGVGYEVFIPLSSYDALPSPGTSVQILTHHYVREEIQALYGFASEEERRLFVRMLRVSGIGPRLALGVLSGMTPRELTRAVAERDIKRLSSISGIGKKTAERLVVELRDKITDAEILAAGGSESSPDDARLRDAALALASLGYNPADARKMVMAVAPRLEPKHTVEDVVRLTLTR